MEGVQTRKGLYGFDYVEIDKRRREEGAEPRRFEIKQLWQRSHEIINLSARGYKNVEIAQILNITPATVSTTLNGELGQHKLSEIRQARDNETKKVVERVRVLTDKALNVYHDIFDNEDGQATLKDRKSVADTVVLELSGLRVPAKTQSQSVHTILTKDELEGFKVRGIQAAQGSDIHIEVNEVNEVNEIEETLT